MQSGSAAEVVLVVDEQQGNREALFRAFRKAGYRVLVASSAADALRVARRFRRRICAVAHNPTLADMEIAEFAAELVRISPKAPLLLLPITPETTPTDGPLTEALAATKRLHALSIRPPGGSSRQPRRHRTTTFGSFVLR